MKNRWIAGLLAVCMMLTVTMGSLPAMAAQDEITEDLRGENTTSEPLTTALQEAVQASLAADAAEGEQPTAGPTGKPGTGTVEGKSEQGTPAEDAEEKQQDAVSAQSVSKTLAHEDYDYTDEYGVEYMIDLYTDHTAKIWKLETASSGTTCVIPSTVQYVDSNGKAESEPYTVTMLNLSYWSGVASNSYTELKLPDTLTDITNSLSGFKKLKELTIPGSVKNFGASLQNMTDLEKLTFEDGVEEISRDSIVYGCSSLTTIQLPRSLKKLSGTGTFSDATALTAITLPEEIENTLPEGIEITQGSTFRGCTALESIELPASITKINDYMFAGCTKLQRVTAKGTIKEIGNNAFNMTSKNKNLVEIPDLSHVTTIGERAFNECAGLKTVDLHNVTSLGLEAFCDCEDLSGEIDLSGLETILDKAFASDAKITSIRFKNTLRSIGSGAFDGTKNVTTIELPNTVESIGESAFKGSGLKGALKLPDSLTKLGNSAFEGCEDLEEVKIGPNLTNIPNNAFADCKKPTKVTIDNSQDNVTGTFPDGVKAEYLVPSVKNAGDTISNEENALTLQQAVDAAESGDAIRIQKPIQLKKPVTVPAGKTVVITSDARQIILGDSSSEPENLFVIEDGASLQLEGSVELYGRYNTKSMILNQGELTLDGADVLITGGTAVLNKGVLDNSGANAKLVLKSGTIEKNKVRGQRTASVRLSEGASFEMSGGLIQNNELVSDPSNSDSSSPAVLLYGLSDFNMTGGEIRENKGLRGGGVVLTGDDTGKAYFEMTGGSINHNVCSSESSAYFSSGAVYVCDDAMFLMGGGEIDANRGGNGGGVCVSDTNDRDANAADVTAFIFDGGHITNNVAYKAGGGVYSLSNGVKLLSGVISGNTASENGGGVYSEGSARYFSPARYTTLYMENAVIRHNTAEQGGGAWFCPTGDAQFYLTNGVALYGNTANGAGDDFASAPISRDRDNSTTIPSRMLGGGKVKWYKDGAIADFSNGANHTTVVSSVSRYDPANPVQVGSIQKQTGGICLKADADADAISTAAGCAQLIIENNTATYGGGIGANGSIVIGDANYQTYETTVRKVWENKGYADAQPDSVTVHLKEKYTGDVVDTVELNAGNAWKHTFADLPDSPEHYTVEEEPVDGYTARYAQDADGSFTITNTYQTKAVSVRKVWVDDDLEFRPASVEVELAAIDRIGAFAPRTAVLSADNNWTYTFDNLPAEHTYLVTEKTQAAGYQTTITGDEGTGFVITNTYQPTPTDTPVVTPPTNPDKPATPPTPPENPDTPVTPPTPPENPDTPVTPPTTPDNPDTPVTPPTTPDNPGTSLLPPFLPLLPLIPLIPLIPWIPDEPATSAPPEQPENPPVEVPAETPEQPEETPPTSVPESEPEEPSSSSEVPENEPEEVKTPTRRLIQTGQNEWLVRVLAAAGGSFLLLGIHKRRKGKHEA